MIVSKLNPNRALVVLAATCMAACMAFAPSALAKAHHRHAHARHLRAHVGRTLALTSSRKSTRHGRAGIEENVAVSPSPTSTTGTSTPEPEAASGSEPLPAGALMFDGFEAANGPNNLITNEYAAWHSSDASAVDSPVWQSDGGSLFSVPAMGENGEPTRVAYTGSLDSNYADRYSEAATHSNKMRFWTKASGFENVRIDASIEPLAWSPEAPSTWGGFKFYLRRQLGETESPFYTVEPYIKDGHAYIQKKCLGDTGGGNYTSGGTYYLLASVSGLGTPLGSWHRIAATARTNPDGSVTIGLYRDGALVLQATDTGVQPDGTGCAPLLGGHVGFRSDYFQYYLDNFEVSPLQQ